MSMYRRCRGRTIGIRAISIIILTGLPILQAYSPDTDHICIKLSYTFDQPIIHQKNINGMPLTYISLPEIPSAGNPGEPDIPFYPVRILLPYNSKVDTIKVSAGQQIDIGTYNIIPVLEQKPMLPGKTDDTIHMKKNQDIYSKSEDFPGTLYQYIGEYLFCGYRILILTLCPIQYNPITQHTTFYQNIELSITTVTQQSHDLLYRGGEDIGRIQEKIDNPVYLATYPLSSYPHEKYDLLILTIDEFREAFVPLQEAHNAQGIQTMIKTLTDVGGSSPERIRDFIRTCYTTYQINFVLLGGDSDIIPIKKLWATVNMGATTDHLPSDLYYACLDGTYNYDGDDKWGEPTDGDNGRDVDLLAEVYVGRASVSTVNEVQNFVEKTITYLQYTPEDEHLKKIVMLGEELDSSTYGDEAMNDIISSAIPPTTYTIETLYDGHHTWTKNELITLIQNNTHMINHLGHSYITYNLRMYNYDVERLTNEKLFFVYTQGCYPGALDEGDCIAEYFTVKTPYAAFAGVWNSRYGWYTPGQVTNGPSHKYHRAFVDGLLKKNKATIGEANHYSKEYFINYINHNAMRWCYYETNLFGDPSVVFCIPNITKPDLDCTGKIDGAKIKPGDTITATFFLKNNGTHRSQLSWEIIQYPQWGIWNFIPASGRNLTPEDGLQTITVYITVPNEKNKNFSGTIKIVNKKNSSDFCNIEVTLSTRSRLQTNHNLFKEIIQRFLQRFPFIKYIFQRTSFLKN